MDKHFTIMIVPEKNKGIRSFKIPGFLFKSLALIVVVISALIGIFIYDYSKILGQIHENKHLSLENRQLREQIQLFQMKLNSLSDDLSRINTFEKKLRIITGLEDIEKTQIPLKGPSDSQMMDDHSHHDVPQQQEAELETKEMKKEVNLDFNFKTMQSDEIYKNYKNIYDKKIAENLGFKDNYQITKRWSELIKNSFTLSKHFASFDYKYLKIKNHINSIEKDITQLDQYLLDKDSVLKSTPTILPANGWITSYFGPRISPTSGRRKMHEGLDVGGRYGTPIVAPADGVVTYSGKKTGFGLFIQLDHGYGVETLFAHAQKLHVRKGDKIRRGTLISEIGNTGYSTGPHLHYEVRVNGIAVDPLYFVLQ